MRWCEIATDVATEVVVFAIVGILRFPIHFQADAIDPEERYREGLLAIVWVRQLGRVSKDRLDDFGVHLRGVSASIRVVQQDLFAE